MVAHLRHADHMKLENFERWLALWGEVAKDVFGPEVAGAFQLGVQFDRERTSAAWKGVLPRRLDPQVIR